MNHVSEKALLKRARRFDPDTLGEVYDRFSPGIYRYAMRLLGDVQLAEDCVSETFSRFLKVLRAGQGPQDHLQAYLFRVAHNWVTDYYRRRPLPTLDLEALDHLDPNASTEKQGMKNAEREQVRNALKLLTPEQRHVIILRFYEGWELEEIAGSLQKDIGAVKALQHRAIAALQRMLVLQEENI